MDEESEYVTARVSYDRCLLNFKFGWPAPWNQICKTCGFHPRRLMDVDTSGDSGTWQESYWLLNNCVSATECIKGKRVQHSMFKFSVPNEEEFSTGSVSVLMMSVKNNTQVLINCRNNKNSLAESGPLIATAIWSSQGPSECQRDVD